MKLDSWRLDKEDGGGGSEKEPVGMLKDPVNEPVGLECDSWLNEDKVNVPDGNSVKLPVGTVKEESARLLGEPVKVRGGTLLCETEE